MTLLSAAALTGLVLLVPLVIVHLRRRAPAAFEVPSLLLWDGLEHQAAPRSRRRFPRLALLLLLQGLALVVLVVALARPAASASPPTPVRVYVLDDSLWMGVPGRLAAAESRIRQMAARLPRGAPVSVVLADGNPRVIYRGPAGRMASGLGQAAPGTAPSALARAMSLVAGLLGSPRDHIVLVRAPEDPVPAARVAPGELRTVAIGTRVADQGIFSPSARCGIGAAAGCEVLATVSSTAGAPVSDRYTAYAAGGQVLQTGSLRLPARSSAGIAFSAPAGAQIRLRLGVRDALTVDDQAWISVPGPPVPRSPTAVTLVGAPSDAQAIARAFAAVPGVSLRLRTLRSYRPADALGAALTVIDGALPAGNLSPSPAVVLIDPSRLPGGRVGGPLTETTVSGEDATSDLLSGLDLSSLAIASGGAHRVTLPGYLTSVVWSPDGPLLAAGDDGSHRVAVLSFDPARSDLPQLTALPILASNLVQWAREWVPSSAPAGEALAVDGAPGATHVTLAVDGKVVARTPLHGAVAQLPLSRPGLYTVTEAGPGVNRRATVAVSVAASTSTAQASPPSAPVDLIATRIRTASTPGPSRAPWLLGAAIVVLALEWAYWRRRAQPVQVVVG